MHASRHLAVSLDRGAVFDARSAALLSGAACLPLSEDAAEVLSGSFLNWFMFGIVFQTRTHTSYDQVAMFLRLLGAVLVTGNPSFSAE